MRPADPATVARVRAALAQRDGCEGDCPGWAVFNGCELQACDLCAPRVGLGDDDVAQLPEARAALLAEVGPGYVLAFNGRGVVGADDIVGACDDSACWRCVPCVKANPQEDWSPAEAVTGAEVAEAADLRVAGDWPTCKLCGRYLGDVFVGEGDDVHDPAGVLA